MAFRNLPEMPCGPILELHGQRKRFHVPYGLKRLIEEMTREPENIYDFLAGFMDTRMQRKLAEQTKNQSRKSWQQHQWSWERGSVLEPDELREFLEMLPAPVEEVNHHAVVIQARKKVKEIRKSLGNTDEQFQELDGKQKSDGKKTSGSDKDSNKRSLNDKPIEEITPETATDEELHAAVTIQAAFRGMHARHEVKKLKGSLAGEGEPTEETQPTESVQLEEVTPVENAADAEQGNEQATETEVTAKPSEDVEAGDATNGKAPVQNQTTEETAIEPQPQVEESVEVVNPPAEGEEQKQAEEGEEEETPNPEETKPE